MNLQALQDKAGLSNTEMAQRLGMHRTSWIRLKTGRSRLTLEVEAKVRREFCPKVVDGPQEQRRGRLFDFVARAFGGWF